MIKKPLRTLKRVVCLDDMAVITSDDLLQLNFDQRNKMRREATAAGQENRNLYVCDQCGFKVYIRHEPKTKLPFWMHFKGAPHKCPWWTGNSKSVNEVSASQFNGKQESPLHFKLKNIIAEILRSDPLTDANSVIVDEYLNGDEGRRRPDVRATYDGRDIAFEIQLSTTQIPIIMQREKFYSSQNRFLIWVTWNLTSRNLSELPTSFQDIYFSHNHNIFSLDQEVIGHGKNNGSFSLRAFWERDTNWNSDIFSLSQLTWPASGLPYAVEAASLWHQDFKRRWMSLYSGKNDTWSIQRSLLNELSQKSRITDVDGLAVDSPKLDLQSLLKVVLSFEQGNPVGSRQNNLKEVVNSFLLPQRYFRYADVLKKIILNSKSADILSSKSVKSKFEKASIIKQDQVSGPVGEILRTVFPELMKDLM